MLMGWNDMFNKQDIIAYHLLPSGKLDRFALPENSAVSGLWSLPDGKLQLTPAPGMPEHHTGFHWNGEKFVPVPSASKIPGGADADSQLAEDDRIYRDFTFLLAQPIEHFGIGELLGRLAEDVGVDQISHNASVDSDSTEASVTFR